MAVLLGVLLCCAGDFELFILKYRIKQKSSYVLVTASKLSYTATPGVLLKLKPTPIQCDLAIIEMAASI